MRIAFLSSFLLVGACATPIVQGSALSNEADICSPKAIAPCTCGAQSGKKICGSSGSYGECACTASSGGPSGSPSLAETVAGKDTPAPTASTPTTHSGSGGSTTEDPPAATQDPPATPDPPTTVGSCIELSSCCDQLRAQSMPLTAADCDSKVTANDAAECTSQEESYTSSDLGTPFCTP